MNAIRRGKNDQIKRESLGKFILDRKVYLDNDKFDVRKAYEALCVIGCETNQNVYKKALKEEKE